MIMLKCESINKQNRNAKTIDHRQRARDSFFERGKEIVRLKT